jgi:YD repeat-containing protein
MQAGGVTDLGVNEFTASVRGWVGEGRTSSRWSEPTTVRVVQGLLATLRDFGVLQGAVNKRIAPSYLAVEAFAYIAFYLKQREASGDRLIDNPDWKLFFLSRDGVERLLIEAHQRGLLEYHAAGRIVRITFPAESLEEYARALAQGPR